MKREFLESLGISKEAIDKIMAENGNDIDNPRYFKSFSPPLQAPSATTATRARINFFIRYVINYLGQNYEKYGRIHKY